jgi:hypothetical protein
MLLEVIVTPDPETEKRLFQRPWALMNFRAAVRRATDALEKAIKANAPKATGDFLASIHSTVDEHGDPFRVICRVISTHEAADIIEFGAAPHVVPSRKILRWMQAIGMRIDHKKDPLDVAFAIQRKIAEVGLKPHHCFSDAFDDADALYHQAVDPIIAAVGGDCQYDFELRSSGSYVPTYSAHE